MKFFNRYIIFHFNGPYKNTSFVQIINLFYMKKKKTLITTQTISINIAIIDKKKIELMKEYYIFKNLLYTICIILSVSGLLHGTCRCRWMAPLYIDKAAVYSQCSHMKVSQWDKLLTCVVTTPSPKL